MSVSDRVEALLAKMTLEEKVAQMDMIRGVTLATKVHPAHFCAVDETSDFYWDRVDQLIGSRGIGFVHDVYSTPSVLNRLQRYFVEKTRLGIPCIFTGEALHGLSYPGAMSFPMPISLGATFDPELVREVGGAIAAETRSLGIHEILAPNLDVARDPRWGRMEETFGEDTCLSSRMAEAIISGEQGGDISLPTSVVCEPKHYVAHGFPEGGLNCSSAKAGEREIRSEFLPVFEAGVRKGGAYNAMAAYHNIDGTPLICSKQYLTDILKGELGLRGYIRADFGAVNRLHGMHHMTRDDRDSIALAVNAGLDVQGFDFPNDYWQETLAALVREGRIEQERIDDAVRRILRVKFELGIFEHPYVDEKRCRSVVRSDAHKEISLRAAQESTVLLKNDGILPISPDVRSIALIGPSSSRQRLGSYASVPYGYEVPSVYEELRRALPEQIEIYQEDGCGISENDYRIVPAAWLPGGVKMSYYMDGDFSKSAVGEEIVSQINFNWGLAKPHPALSFNGYGVRMQGTIAADGEGFDGQLIVPCEDSVRLYVDGQLVIDRWNGQNVGQTSVPFVFAPGTSHGFVLEFVCDKYGRNVTLAYSRYSEGSFERAVEMAKKADLTILVCGDDTVTSGEGMDRNELKLFGPQRELVRRVAETGKPTVLVLEVGKPVDLTAEEPNMNAILLPWFGGELGARAIVQVLLGQVDPSGRLPVTFPKDVGSLPGYYTLLPGGSTEYLEGRKEPRYPFGHGLSYTQFEILCMKAEPTGSDSAIVACTVKNTGERAGTAVVQLYVEDPVSTVVTPDRRLCAFERVILAPGEEKELTFALDERAFRLMNARREWVVEPGDFVLHMGFSSADIRAAATITL